MTFSLELDNKKVEVSLGNFIYVEDKLNPEKSKFYEVKDITKETWEVIEKWLEQYPHLEEVLPSSEPILIKT
jgi:inorganic pyrophosphatase